MSDEKETIGSIIGKAVTAMVVSLGVVGVMSATEKPNTCIRNETSQEVRVEIRNYSPGYYESVHEMRPCLNADGSMGSCPYDGSEWHSGSYQWRYADKYTDPEEGWTNWSGDPEKSSTGYSYFLHRESDTAVCDGRERFKDKDGQVIKHNVSDTFYMA